MAVYSALLAAGLVVGAPWWLWRMTTSGRYRAGLAGRLGKVPRELQGIEGGVVWVHCVSVGEVLGALRLIRLLRERFSVVVSTTTLTGQTVAREKLAGVPVFYLPLDFAYAVRRYLRVLRPRLMVLMESELWPRLLVECERAGVPVAVVNARISDRSYPRSLRLRRLWRPFLGRVAVFLAQGEETGARLRALGVAAERVRVTGNLKYDAPVPGSGRVVEWIRDLAGGRKVMVAGSTLPGEEAMVLSAWRQVLGEEPETLLVLAPRHPERFQEVEAMVRDAGFKVALASAGGSGEVVLLDTLGDLAGVYALASVAFVGGSLVPKGGHNPLEAARFGVPVAMGTSYENFREVVEAMRAAGAIRICSVGGLGAHLVDLLRNGAEMGGRARAFYDSQAGATERTMAALLELAG